ncbi:MAG: 3-dehydroquinate synthase [Clostridia bacterium]|nr:3-dehydroquinate synthase [Clostridia bacterium]
MGVLKIDLKERSYDIIIEKGCLKNIGEAVHGRLPKAQKAAVLSDTNVAPLYAQRVLESLEKAGLEAHLLVLPAGEETKCLQCLSQCYDFLCEHRLSRSDVLITLGGGVIGDLGGLAAATYLRGIPFVQVPTSLLAQVDSSVGGKVAIDLPQGKNLCGCFYQPQLVMVDPQTLKTLTDQFWRDGMGEVVKYGCIRDEKLFDLLCRLNTREAAMAHIEEIIAICLKIKAQVVENDERDTGERMILNFGHTLAHAIEAAQHFTGLRHGEAVAIGMALITRLSENEGLTERGTYQRLLDCLKAQGLPFTVSIENKEAILPALSLDKKHLNGQLKVVLLNHIGQCCLHKAPGDFFREVPQWL